jgi:hypothetical protein
MKAKFLILLAFPILAPNAESAVIVTYRGENPPTFNPPPPFYTEKDFDVNADGIADYRFLSGYFIAAIQGYTTNRFISTLEPGFDVGGNVAPVTFGTTIGPGGTSMGGEWHHHSDKGGGTMFGLNTGPMSMQLANAYIGVEFAAEDGIHYGWIQYVGYNNPELQLDTNVPGGFIDSWAWETQPGVPIIAGQVPEPTLAICFVTGLGSMMLRRKRS